MEKYTTPEIRVFHTMDEYLQKADWRVNANSNQGYSLGGMILNNSGKITANYWLSHVYSEAIGAAHREGDIHIHDLDMFSGYCAGWSLRMLLEEGFNGVEDKIECDPPKNLHSAVGQMVNFLGTLQNEWAGAQAFSSFDTYLSPFVKKYALEQEQELLDLGLSPEDKNVQESLEKKVYKYVYDAMQYFVFNLNVPSRWGTQTPFTNITMDWTCPEDLKSKRLLLHGESFPHTFGELQREMDMVNKAYLEVVMKGDRRGRVFTFPIPTYNITPDFQWDHPNTALLFELTAKYGLPYFQNFLNSDLKPHHVRSMCCRLQLNLTELLKRGNGLFGSAEMTGSIGVVTVNGARIGYLYKGDKEAYKARLLELMDLAMESLEEKRRTIMLWMERGLFPYTKRYLGTLRNHFSTIGINGMHESMRNFFEDDLGIMGVRGKEFTAEILDLMRERLVSYQEITGHLYNLEASPAEGATYRFAKEDKKRYPDILQSGTEAFPYYTNSSQLPVEFSEDPFEVLTHQDEFQRKYTGGTVLHLYLGERLQDGETCKKLVRTVLENFRLPYITISPTFSICPKHGYIAGEHEYCPSCDEEIGYGGGEELSEERVAHTSEEKKAFILS